MSKAGQIYAVLLKSCHGYKEERNKLKPIGVHKGTLLVYLNPLTVNRIQEKYDRPVNYKVADRRDNQQSEAVLFVADSSSILHITMLQREFLLAVKQTHYRMEVLERKLQWVESLTVGSEVYVTIATIPAPVRGIVRYIGKLSDEEGKQFGIEIMEHRGKGTNDGQFKKQKYFKCDKDCAVFVAMDKITDDSAVKAAQVTETPDALPKPLARDNLIKTNDHITFCDKYDIHFRGIVKWIGTDESTDKVVVGIEVEGDLPVADFPNHVNREDMSHFSSKKSKIFLPIDYVELDTSIGSDIHSDNHGHSENVHITTTAGESNNPHDLVVGSAVQYIDHEQYGIIKWIGTLSGIPEVTYAGVEMEDIVDDFGGSDGSWEGVKYFSCKPNRGKFIRLNGLKPDQRLKHKTLPATEKSFQTSNQSNDTHAKADCNSTDNIQPVDTNSCNLKVGSDIQYGMPIQYGVIKWIGKLPDQAELFAGVEMYADVVEDCDDGVWFGVRYYDCKPNRGVFVHLSELKPAVRMIKIIEDESSTKPNITGNTSFPVTESSLQNPYNFTLGCTVQYGKPVKYGVIKWIGKLPKDQKTLYAGLVLDEGIVKNAHDGVWNGKRYYDCKPNRGKFVKMKDLKPFNEGMKKRCSADNILLKCTDEAVTPEHRSLGKKHCSEDNVLSPTHVRSHQNPYKLEVGSTVQYGKPAEYGVIKWIERLPGREKILYAGVEMENIVENYTDGMYKGVRYFKSSAGRGKFVKLLELEPDKRFIDSPTPQHVFKVGNKVEVGRSTKEYGVISWVGNVDGSGEDYVKVITEKDSLESGYIPLSMVQFDSRHLKPSSPTESQHIKHKLETGSLVQFGDPVQYGVITRIETEVDTSREVAEVETENNKLKKIPLAELQPDYRFIIDVNKTEGNINPLEKEFYKHDESLLPIQSTNTFDTAKHTGTKGIQGFKNSCYLDATLYGTFTFSDTFDILFLEEVTTNAEELNLQKRLKSDIVYPLRKKGIVVQESIEGFRQHLAKLQNMKGLTSEEKDPEEFLNLLFKHVFHVEPFMTIRRPSGIDKEFFIQLFVEPDESEPAVNTQRLLNKMFQEQNITFVQHPARLLLQMPRYGKRFKSFQRIIPSLELNIARLCMMSGLCSVCQYQMGYVCNDCSSQKSQMRFYCSACSPQWHQSYCDHQHFLYNNDFDTGTLQLLSVLCIETSHYVCFTRITGSGKDEWVFFDSMAERQDNGYNLPKVTHCTDQLQEYVYGKKDIGKILSKSLPELVRRFVEDVYLCIYIDHDGVMYQ